MNWEEGQVKTITVAATAGNATIEISPGTGKKWWFMYGRITVVTDATVADRKMNMQVQNAAGTQIYYKACANTTAQTASLTRQYTYAESTGGSAAVASVDLAIIPIPNPFIISETDEISFSVSAGVAGDSYSGFIKVTELPA